MHLGAEGLERYLGVLTADAVAGQLIELRYRSARGMGQVFLGAEHPERAADTIAGLARRSDTFVGTLLRDRAAGGRRAISRASFVWVEIDALDAHQRLEQAPVPPTMTIASGSPGHLHAYWRLTAPVSPQEAETANRKLASSLGADLACVDAARILRPPQTLNFKSTPPQPVELLEIEETRRYDLQALVGGLEDPHPARRDPGLEPQHRRQGGGGRHHRGEGVDRLLREVAAREYVHALTGAVPNLEEKFLCPFHEEHTPSLQAYEDGSFFCFGCGAGGSVIDFAARLWGMGTKGRDFLMLRDRLAEELLGRGPTDASPEPSARRARRTPSTTQEEMSR